MTFWHFRHVVCFETAAVGCKTVVAFVQGLIPTRGMVRVGKSVNRSVHLSTVYMYTALWCTLYVVHSPMYSTVRGSME
jgi:hypothetical protein